MKQSRYLVFFASLCGLGLLVAGCLFKHERVPARNFILTAIPASESGPVAARPLQVEVGFVKMPSYLLRESLAVRQSAGEFKYLENAQWAERLDQGFRRILTRKSFFFARVRGNSSRVCRRKRIEAHGVGRGPTVRCGYCRTRDADSHVAAHSFGQRRTGKDRSR